MKRFFLFSLFIINIIGAKSSLAQTDGTLTFSFTQIAHSPCYSLKSNALAVWIQTNNGTFVKTRLRQCCYGQTNDHLSTFAVNGGSTWNNAFGANSVDAVVGATLKDFGTRTITWDGKDVNGKENGNTVADGIYKVTIEETWNHGSSSTVKSYSFTKGPAMDSIVFADNADFKNVTLKWVPTSTVGIKNYEETSDVSVFPNPNYTGIFTLNFKKANSIRVLNTIGEIVYDEKLSQTTFGTTTLNLTNLANGVYMILVSDGEKTTHNKIILSK